MKFIEFDDVRRRIRGRTVAVVGSAPSVLDNEVGLIDAHDLVVRVNNYKTSPAAGFRTDVFYSFFGGSIRKNAADLQADGVQLCMCKCPNAKPIESPWHEERGKQLGVDFRYIYEQRRDWWFCDTYIPTVERFLESFNLLERHMPTTGFAAVLDLLACEPRMLYLTGFDFFSSGLHNVDEKWKPGDPSDPIGHAPRREAAYLRTWVGKLGISFDDKLLALLGREP